MCDSIWWLTVICQQPNPDLSSLEILQDGIAIQSSILEVVSDSLREPHVGIVA